MHHTENPYNRLAAAVQELLEGKDLDEISVRDITGKCGMTRQVFYHYFSDKYTLVSWVHNVKFAQILQKEEYRDVEDVLLLLLNYIEANKTYFLHIYTSQDQNALPTLILDEQKRVMTAAVQYLTGRAPNDHMLFLIGVYADTIQNQIQKCLLVKRGGASAWLLHRDLRDACPIGLASVLHGKRIPKQVILDAISGPSKNRTAAGGTISL